MQFNHIASWIVHEDLLRLWSDDAFGDPIKRAHPIELGTSRHDVLHAKRHMGTRGVLPWSLGKTRGALYTHQVDLCTTSHIHPVAWNSGNLRPTSIDNAASGGPCP